MMLPFAMDGKILEAVHILCLSPTEMSACDVESGQKFVRNYLPSEFVALLRRRFYKVVVWIAFLFNSFYYQL